MALHERAQEPVDGLGCLDEHVDRLASLESPVLRDRGKFVKQRQPEAQEHLHRLRHADPPGCGDAPVLGSRGAARGERCRPDFRILGVDEAEERGRDLSPVVAIRSTRRVIDLADPRRPGDGLAELAMVDPHHVLRRLAESFETGALAPGGRQEGEHGGAREPAVSARGRERTDLAGIAPPPQCRSRHSDERAGLLDAQPFTPGLGSRS